MTAKAIAFIVPIGNATGYKGIYASFVHAMKAGGQPPLAVVPRWMEHAPAFRSFQFLEGSAFSQKSIPSDPSRVESICYERQDDLLSVFPNLISFNRQSVILIPVDKGAFFSVDKELMRLIGAFCLIVPPMMEDTVIARGVWNDLVVQGFPREKIILAGMNEGIPGGIKVEDRTAEFPLEFSLSYDPSLLLKAENEGCLLLDVSPKSPLSQNIVRFARKASHLACLAGQQYESQGSFMMDSIVENVSSDLWHSTNSAVLMNPSEMEGEIERRLRVEVLKQPESNLSADQWDRLKQSVKDSILGWGPLEALMRDVSINEIMINRYDQIYVERDGIVEKTAHRFLSSEQLQVIVERMVSQAGRRVDTSSPMCDVRLPDGSRLNVILPPVSLDSPVITIRRFRPAFRTFDDLLSQSAISAWQRDVLREAVETKQNILIAGNSGAGKTTLLNILSGCIGGNERVITIEDAAELQLQQPHVIRLESRRKNAEGEGEIRMEELVANALRMRPDRIIVGECRGPEVIPMLQAMNTGHHGSLATIHSNSAVDALKRLESLVLLNASNWPVDVVREQIASALDLVVYLHREGENRIVKELVAVQSVGREYRLTPLMEPLAPAVLLKEERHACPF